MQNDLYRITGVSPAYFVSRYGTSFSVNHVIRELDNLAKAGFPTVQLEIFEQAVMADWVHGGFREVLRNIEKKHMNVSAFVAHFLGHIFTSPENMAQGKKLSDLDTVLSLLTPLNREIPLAVPLLPVGKEKTDAREAAELLNRIAARTKESGRDFIVEIVPGSIAGSYSGFLEESCWSQHCEDIGFLLDTGHAHVTGEDIPALIGRMGSRLKALHLSDNDGVVNNSNPPGKGNLDWKGILSSLEAIGFSGSLDLEIVASDLDLEASYDQGRNYLSQLL